MGDNLIILFSQERSGSTLLQRMLGVHSEIHTTTEPSFMLVPLRGLRSDGYASDSDGYLRPNAVRAFLKTLPGGEEEYFEGVRRMSAYIYGRALEGSGKRYFLDKTPAYVDVLPEMYHALPEGRFIVLLRNPVAVLCSVLETFVGDNWFSLSVHRDTLFNGPRFLVEGMELLGDRCVVVHYERLVSEPEVEMRRICEELGVGFEAGMIDYGSQDLPRWEHGDQVGVYQHTRPEASNVEKWHQTVRNPQSWRLAHDYLRLVGQETMERLGYPYEQLRQELEAHRPGRVSLMSTLSLERLLRVPSNQTDQWQPFSVRLARSLRQRGVLRTLSTGIRRVTLAIKKGRGTV
jgi:hypothetical protein